MSTATVSRTARKPRTAASLIASEFNRYQAPEPSPSAEIAAPTPSGQLKTETPATSPVILVLVAFVAVTVLVKILIGFAIIAAKITKKIAHQIAAFVATQMGSRGSIDYRVYSAIFDEF